MASSFLLNSSNDAVSSDSLARMVNDSPYNYANAVMKRIIVCGKVHICLIVAFKIKAGAEIR